MGNLELIMVRQGYSEAGSISDHAIDLAIFDDFFR
jgi:hypothetical protein